MVDRSRDDGDKVARLPGVGSLSLGEAGDVPEGKLEVFITYLEMREVPAPRPVPHRTEQLALMRARRPTASFYRYLYDTVGTPWLWFERRALDDGQLLELIARDEIEIEVLYVDGVPAGYFELDRSEPREVELSYFGLVPDFIGLGLGTWLLDRAIEHAWTESTRRVWVHTCTLDHPSALGVYQRAGFGAYRRERVVIDDPRLKGLMPD